MYWANGISPVAARDSDLWLLNLDGLFEAFRTSVAEYQRRLLTDEKLQVAFEESFELYGSTLITH